MSPTMIAVIRRFMGKLAYIEAFAELHIVVFRPGRQLPRRTSFVNSTLLRVKATFSGLRAKGRPGGYRIQLFPLSAKSGHLPTTWRISQIDLRGRRRQ